MAFRIKSEAHRAIYDGIRILEAGSCLKFVPRTNQRDYISFFQGDGCYAYVGRKGGAQVNIRKFEYLKVVKISPAFLLALNSYAGGWPL